MKSTYPKTIRVAHFKQFKEVFSTTKPKYVFEEIVYNQKEESIFYEGLNHESNLKIEIL